MKIVLVNIYPADTVARYLLSSYVIKGYLIANKPSELDVEVEILNFSNIASVRTMANKIERLKPDVVGYSCYVWNIEIIYDLMYELKNRITSINVLGGPEISFQYINNEARSRLADYFILGEGEKKFLDLMCFLNFAHTEENLPKGIATWNEEKK